MERIKKYRILSIEAEKLVHMQAVGGFSTRENGEPNERLFTGILDYSLESEKIYEEWKKEKILSRKTYFSKNGYNYIDIIHKYYHNVDIVDRDEYISD